MIVKYPTDPIKSLLPDQKEVLSDVQPPFVSSPASIKAIGVSGGGSLKEGTSFFGSMFRWSFFLSLLTPDIYYTCFIASCDVELAIFPSFYDYLLLWPMFSLPIFLVKWGLFYWVLILLFRHFKRTKAIFYTVLFTALVSVLIPVIYGAFTREGKVDLVRRIMTHVDTREELVRALSIFDDEQKISPPGEESSRSYRGHPIQINQYCFHDCIEYVGSTLCFSGDKLLYRNGIVMPESAELPRCDTDFSFSCHLSNDDMDYSQCFSPKQQNDTKDSLKQESIPIAEAQSGENVVVSGSLATSVFEADLVSVWGWPVRVAGRVTRSVKLTPAPGSDSVSLRVCDGSQCLSQEYPVFVAEGDAVVAIDIEFVNKNQSTGDDIRDRAHSAGDGLRFRTENTYWPSRNLSYHEGYLNEWYSSFSVGIEKPTRMTFWTRVPAETQEIELLHWHMKRVPAGNSPDIWIVVPDMSDRPAFSLKVNFDQ